MLMHKSVTLFEVGTSSLEPVSAPCIPQTKGPNKVYSVLVNVEQGAVIVRYQPGSRETPNIKACREYAIA